VRLPAELWDHILDYLYDEPRALYACSLVCRMWRPSGQLHLFHTIHITSIDRWNKFRTLVRASPRLAHTCVRKVIIHHSRDGFWSYGALDAPLAALEAVHIMQCYPLIPNPFLRCFRNASDVTFEQCWFADFQAFQATLRCFLPIQKLGVCGVGWLSDEEKGEIEGADAFELSLDSLFGQLESDSGIIEWLLRCITPHSVRHLRHDPVGTMDFIPRAMLMGIGRSLRSLQLIMQDDVLPIESRGTVFPTTGQVRTLTSQSRAPA
jgi:hypothetical protein